MTTTWIRIWIATLALATLLEAREIGKLKRRVKQDNADNCQVFKLLTKKVCEVAKAHNALSRQVIPLDHTERV